MKIKTTWDYSLKSEATRLIHCAHQIVIGFYRVNNFIVLPYNPKVNNALITTFPDLNYRQIPRFWREAKKTEIVFFPIKTKNEFLNRVADLLSEAKLPAPSYRHTQRLWGKAQDEILAEIYRLIPAKKDLIKKIIIHPTKFGTSCSFGLIKKDGSGLEMYLRDNQGIVTITEAILSSLTRDDVYKKLGGLWNESEILVDWLLTHSSLREVLKKYDKIGPFTPTLKGTRVKQQARLMAESEAFYQKLGLPTNRKIFSLNGLTPEIQKKPVENLSAQEKTVLRALIENSNTTVSFDNLANILFASEDNFSLYAIAKTIERLRNKLEENGLSGSYIQTLRGQGYILKN